MSGDAVADVIEPVRPVDRGEFARDAQELRITGVGVGACHLRHLQPVGPFDLERRRRQIKRSGKMAFGAETGFGDGLLAGQQRHARGKLRRRHAVAIDVIGGAGDRGAQPLGRKTRDALDAGDAGGKLGPIVGLADAERRHHADAGDGDDGTTGFVDNRASQHFSH